jgi:hypothetical protein
MLVAIALAAKATRMLCQSEADGELLVVRDP